VVLEPVTPEQVKEIQLDILTTVDQICRENGIDYTIAFGTLLGAVRHQGFIPWDDDIDIELLRPQYERLIELLPTALPPHLRLLHHSTQPTYFPFAKIYDNRAIIESKLERLHRHSGVFIDLFPIDNTADDDGERELFHNNLARLTKNLAVSNPQGIDYASASNLKYFLGKLVLWAAPHLRYSGRWRQTTSDIERELQKFNGTNTNSSGFLGLLVPPRTVPRVLYDQYEDTAFDGLTVRKIKDHHTYLNLQYGDYMMLPPENERQNHAYYHWYWKTNQVTNRSQPVKLPPYSVLITVYKKDSPDHFIQALESILNQSVPSDNIVISVDGPLSGELDEIVNHYEANYPQISTVRQPTNIGQGLACAAALPFCQHDVVARMDADDISFPERMEKQLTYLSKHPQVKLLSANLLEFEGDIDNIVSLKKVPAEDKQIRKLAKRWNPINHPAVLFSKKAALEAGNYQHFPRYEDYHLWVRMLMAGNKAANIQEPLLYYRVSPENLDRRRKGDAQRAAAEFHRWKYEVGFTGRFDMWFMTALMAIISVVPGRVFRFIYRLKRGNYNQKAPSEMVPSETAPDEIAVTNG
jgi:lipopolysaccharide cholinephosphotransferase